MQKNLDAALFRPFFDKVLAVILSPRGFNIQQVRTLQILTAELLDLVEMAPSIIKGVAEAISVPAIANRIHELCDLSFDKPSTTDHVFPDGACYQPFLNTQLHLCLTLFSLTVTAALKSQSGPCLLPATLATKFLQGKAHFAADSALCCHHSRKRPLSGKTSLVEQMCTPDMTFSSQNWRARLATDLEHETIHRRELLIRNVGLICQDLEDRCERIEEPLRLERAKVEDLMRRNDELTAQVASMEAEAAEQRAHSDSLKEQKHQLLSDVEKANSHNSEVVQRAEKLESMLRVSTANAEIAIASLRSDYNRMELEWRAKSCSKEEELEQCTIEMSRLTDELRALTESLSTEKLENSRLHTVTTGLQKELQDTHDRLQSQSVALDQKNMAYDTLALREGELVTELESSRVELGKVTSELDLLKEEYKFRAASLEKEKENLSSRHQLELRTIAESNSEAMAGITARLKKAEIDINGLNESQSAKSEQIRQKDSAILQLQARLARSEKLCSAKDAELSEAKEMKHRLMAVIGGDSNALRSTAARPQQKCSIDNPTNRTVAIASPDEDDMAVLNQSFGSATSSRSGRTPKRVKSRTIKTPVLRKLRPRMNVTVENSPRSRRFSDRAPLTALGDERLNRPTNHVRLSQHFGGHSSPTRASAAPMSQKRPQKAKSPQKVHDAIHEETIDDLSFDASSFLRSTDVSFDLPYGNGADYDDRTDEFD